MKTAIAECFKTAGCFGQMRDPALIASMRELIDAEDNPIAPVPEDVEVDGELNVNDLIAEDDALERDLVNAVESIAFEEDEDDAAADDDDNDDDDDDDEEI